MTIVIGWDIGGANLKAARAQGGRIVALDQRACAPHEGLASLETAIRATLAQLGPAPRHRVTMTAELSDAFPARRAGVVSIAAIIAREIGDADLSFYAGAQGLVPRSAVEAAADHIASANWRVSAQLAAQRCAAALFIDMGSTTTDIVPILDGRIVARGASDAQRLAAGELVYGGFSRGAPQAFAQMAPIDGAWTPLVNEAFAAMADVRRVLGDLPEGDCSADLAPTADGRPKTRAAAQARLARLAGRDAVEMGDAQLGAFARFLAEAQWRCISDQIALLASRGDDAADAPIVGAGVGRGLIARFAQAQRRSFIDFADFVPCAAKLRAAAADCAPAAALALLK